MSESTRDLTLDHHQEERDSAASDRELLQTESLAQSLAFIPAGLEVVPDSGKEPVQVEKEVAQAEKEAISGAEKEVVNPAIEPDGWHAIVRGPTGTRKICGLRASIFVALLVSVAAVCALAIGLGVGLNKLHDDGTPNSTTPSASEGASSSSTDLSTSPTSAEYRIGGSIDASYYSREGAWNGTGIALASQSFPSNLQDAPLGSLVMYFQHHTSEIRFMRLTSEGEWVGGSASEVVATNAKNSTPIAAVAYVKSGTSHWHIFYIDVNNQIRQRSNSNTTNLWTDGTIDHIGLTAHAGDLVGMQACWAGSDGSSEYGMRIWFASNSTTFQEYIWHDPDDTWKWQRDWTGYNGAAGVGCYSWGEGTTAYVTLVTLKNNVELWYKDDNDQSVGGTAGYTQSALTPSSSSKSSRLTRISANIVLPGVYAATSLAYTNFLYAQTTDSLRLQAYNISWAGNTTDIFHNDTFSTPGDPGLPGTHFAATALPNQLGGDDLNIFFQVNGSDITEYVRSLDGGTWAEVDIPIPLD